MTWACRESGFLRFLHWSCLLVSPIFAAALPLLRLYFVGNVAPNGAGGIVATVFTCISLQLNVSIIASEGALPSCSSEGTACLPQDGLSAQITLCAAMVPPPCCALLFTRAQRLRCWRDWSCSATARCCTARCFRASCRASTSCPASTTAGEGHMCSALAMHHSTALHDLIRACGQCMVIIPPPHTHTRCLGCYVALRI